MNRFCRVVPLSSEWLGLHFRKAEQKVVGMPHVSIGLSVLVGWAFNFNFCYGIFSLCQCGGSSNVKSLLVHHYFCFDVGVVALRSCQLFKHSLHV